MRNSAKEKNMVFGIQPVLESIEGGREIEKIFIQKGIRSSAISEILNRASALKLPVSRIPEQKLRRFTRKNHQGVVCLLSPINYASLDHIVSQTFEMGRNPLILILDRITDVRNFGAIARSAECANVDAIVIPFYESAQINSDAMKTSSGALNYIPVCRTARLKDDILFLKSSGIQIVACTEKTNQILYDLDLTMPTALIMGSEEKGVSESLIRISDHTGKIPLFGKINSLNVSAAAAVAVFEAIRQRNA